MTPQQMLFQACAGFLATSATSDTLSNVIRALAAFAGSAGGAGVQPAPYIWVAPNGNDTTGARGNIGLPFATVGAALGAALTGDTVLIAPGTYPAVDFGDFPPALLAVSLVGVGAPELVTIEASSGPALRWQPGPVSKRLSLQNLTLRTLDAVANAAVLAGPGSGVPNNSAVELQGCRLQAVPLAALRAANLARVDLDDCAGVVRVENCNGGSCVDHRSGDLAVQVSDPVPAHVTRGLYLIRGGSFGIIALEGEAWIDGDRAARAVAVNGGSALQAAGPTASLAFAGQAALVDLYLPATPGGNYDLDGAEISNLQVQSQIPAPSTTTIRALGATVRDATLTSPGGGDLVLDTRGGFLDVGASSFGADCYWDRCGGGADAVSVASGVNAILFGSPLAEPAFPPGTPVAFVATMGTLPALISDQIAVTASGADGCQIESGFAAPITCRLAWSRQG